MSLIDFRAQTGRAAEHLLIKNTRFYAAHKDNLCNLRHVNACRKQVYRNRNCRIMLVLEALDCILDARSVADCAGDFFYRICRYFLVFVDFPKLLYNLVRMAVVHRKNYGLFLAFRVNMF